MTTGEKLVELSSLQSGKAIDHLANIFINQTTSEGMVFVGSVDVGIEKKELSISIDRNNLTIDFNIDRSINIDFTKKELIIDKMNTELIWEKCV